MRLFKTILNLMTAPGAAVLPLDEDVYIGLWQGENGTLRIEENGDVDYRRTPGADFSHPARSLPGRLERIDDERFAVRANNGTDAVYNVQSAPYQEGRAWKLVFDGEELSRLN